MKVVVEADGGSRGNPGPAGYGAVVLDPETDAVLAERAEGLGVATNNVAEYQGLIAGLRAAAELNASEVSVRMDSKLVVEQMSGRWKIKHPQLQPLAVEARKLASRFDRVGYEWIPRARNARADRLANEAMDAQAGTPSRRKPSTSAADRATATVTSRAGESRLADSRTAAGESAGSDRTAAPVAAQTAPPAAWNGATGSPTRLLLLRHGQTEFSVQRRYSGRGDLPLTEAGREQAAAAARRLSTVEEVAAVVCSPLARARQTAEAVASATGAELVAHQGLVEIDFGDWEGLTFAEAAEKDPELHRRWLSDPSVPTPGGESFEQVHRRVRRSRDDVIAKFGGRTIIVVSHVTPIKMLLRMALDAGPSLLFRLHLDLASMSIAEFYPDGNASVRLVNDTSHLSPS